jgi:hypothetical protein
MIQGKNKGRLFWPLIIVAGSVALAVWSVPDPHLPTALPAREQSPWTLPSLDDMSAIKEANRIVSVRKPWGRGKRSIVKEAVPSQTGLWRLRGIVCSGDQRFALIEVENKVRRYREGEAIPGGGTLRVIYEDQIEVEGPEGARIIKLHHPGA